MKNINFRGLLSAICIASVLATFTHIDAGPVRFDQVVQVVNARPGSANATTFTTLCMADDFKFLVTDETDDDKKVKATLPQDGRVITETRTEIVTDDVCDCEEDVVIKRGFPKWALLGLAAIPIAFILIRRRRDRETPTPTATIPNMTPTPTPGMTPTPTPGMTPTPTPGMTPTPTPKMTPTPTPKMTPSPTPKQTPSPTPPHVTPTPPPPEPVPEPMTILLFGTGLASIGMAARRKFGKKGEKRDEKDEE